MPQTTLLTQEESNFVEWLQETLIPDLHDSGTHETAKDFEHCVEIIQRLGHIETRGRPRRSDGN